MLNPFQPTLPARGATCARARKATRWEHISTHAPRTGSDLKKLNCLPV